MSKLTSDEWEQKINQMQSDLSQARKEKAKARRQEIEKFRRDVGKLMTSFYPEYTTLSDFEKAFARVQHMQIWWTRKAVCKTPRRATESS